MDTDARVTIVLLTHDRPFELGRAVYRLRALPERPRIIVVDNGSRDAPAVRRIGRFADVELIRSEHNLGAAGRNDYAHLKAIPIFGELSLPDLRDLYRAAQEVSYPVGSSIIEQGAPSRGLVVLTDGKVDVVIYKQADSWSAYSNFCTHVGALLTSGWVADGQVHCPFHYARFDIKTGECVYGPGYFSLPVFNTKIEGDSVQVQLPAPPDGSTPSIDLQPINERSWSPL